VPKALQMLLKWPDCRIAAHSRRRSRQNRRCGQPIALGVSVETRGGAPGGAPCFYRQAPPAITSTSSFLQLYWHCVNLVYYRHAHREPGGYKLPGGRNPENC
jgi:hypothetical protein